MRRVLLTLIGCAQSASVSVVSEHAVFHTACSAAAGRSVSVWRRTRFANFASHAIKGHVWWRCAAVFCALGAVGGSSLGKAMDGDRLIFFFGIVMVVVGALMLEPRKALAVDCRPVDLRMCLATAAVALAAGAASGFSGIGGGFLIMPGLMLATGMPMINAIGTSLLSVGAFGLATALNYASSGLVDWWLAAEFIGGGIVGGVFGMLLATRLSAYTNILNRLFAALIFMVAAYILYRNWGTVVPG
ncbi:sulfite exporter TauE/SafE family protein [Rhizobium sp. 007]|uniref:sulfite exporter TauE/SafE family protein n=1 Tax=Rhizobium sp. 007 TaxID=2785056 RepID=UPI00188F0103|nr:sulfite exporter TauE/SafE family protein [Rhizobium sp. 007]QPB18555.1 sulfite exporter TauE/SafE family protein [Rhizobium sp. 007]